MITSAHRVPISSFCPSISRSSHLPWQFSSLLCGSQSNFYAILIIRKPFPSCSVESIVLKQCLILCSLFLEPKYSQLACKSPEALTKEQCNMKSILVHCIYQSCHLHLECVPLPLGSKHIYYVNVLWQAKMLCDTCQHFFILSFFLSPSLEFRSLY